MDKGFPKLTKLTDEELDKLLYNDENYPYYSSVKYCCPTCVLDNEENYVAGTFEDYIKHLQIWHTEIQQYHIRNFKMMILDIIQTQKVRDVIQKVNKFYDELRS